MIESDELKRAAEAATPGPWVINDEDSIDEGGPHLMTADGYAIADFWGNDSSLGLKKNEENAAYIAAANPATILALIARIEAAEAELAQERKHLDWALAHEAALNKSTLSWVNSTGAIEMRAVPVGALRETIDVLMQEVG